MLKDIGISREQAEPEAQRIDIPVERRLMLDPGNCGFRLSQRLAISRWYLITASQSGGIKTNLPINFLARNSS